MKIRLILKTFNLKLLNIVNTLFKQKLKELKIKHTNFIILPIVHKKFCVLKSPHVDKDAREQFEIKLYKAIVDLNIFSFTLLKILLSLEIPSGIIYTLKILKYN
uniref:Ribosomal protein S10 n=1 Tax=Spumella sp. NIES-1846 TaxID=2490549 RepID=A0A455RGJ2_9STRA|nr:ribosomal protein S10 [Spumella sp. NIES-1846]